MGLLAAAVTTPSFSLSTSVTTSSLGLSVTETPQVPEDTLCLTSSFPPEITVQLNAVFDSNDPATHQTSVTGIIDSGTGLTYIMSGGQRFKTRKVSRMVQLADQKIVEVTEAVDVHLKLTADEEFTSTELLFLPNCNKKGNLSLLVGRGLCKTLGLTIDFSTGKVQRGSIEIPSAKVPLSTDNVCTIALNSALSIPLPPELNDYVRSQLPKGLADKSRAIVDTLIDYGWYSPHEMPGFQIRFQRLDEDPPDVEGQLCSAYLKAPPLSGETSTNLFATKLYKKLTDGQKVTYTKLVEQYLSAGW